MLQYYFYCFQNTAQEYYSMVCTVIISFLI
jgi:hypothetical protein